MSTSARVIVKMLSRTFLFAYARVLLGQTRCLPEAASLKNGRVISVEGASSFSNSCILNDTPNKPGKSGDRGPERNYRKKVLKKQRKAMNVTLGGIDLDELVKEMKLVESQPRAQAIPAGHITSLMSRTKKTSERDDGETLEMQHRAERPDWEASRMQRRAEGFK